MRRVSSGNPRLDRVLGGGLPRHSVNIVMGTPGTGKTVLAEQLVFANGTPDRPAIYLSTLSEPLSKLLTYLQTFTFVDVDRLGTDVIYDGLDEVLRENPDRLPETCARLLEQYRPSVVVIDSFKAIADLVPDTLRWRKMVFELAGLFSAYDLTTLWVGEYAADSVSRDPEFAIADGVFTLERERTGSRDDRFLHVVKLRGSEFLDGRHALRISRDGLEIFPRLISPEGYGDEQVPERLHSGIEGLDRMIEAGWLRGTSTLVQGPSGAGKTMLGLHFLRQGVADGEAALLVNFQENPVQIVRAMKSLGWDTEPLLGPGRLDLFYTSRVELHIDTIVQELLRRIETNRVRRVVIDALGDLAQAARDPARLGDYVCALTQEFAVRGVSAMMIAETGLLGPGGVAASMDVSYMSDNILVLAMEMGEELERTVRIVKTRGSAHDGSRHLLRIGRGGLEIA